MFSRVNKQYFVAIFLFLLFAFSLISTNVTSSRTLPFADEYIFARVTQNLPDYHAESAWLTQEHPELAPEPPMWWPNAVYEDAYDCTVWIHPPLPNILTYPLLLVLDPIEDIKILRIVPLILYLVTVALIADIIRRRKGPTIAGLSLLPLLLCGYLINGGLWFYYDVFMWLFFVLSLWLIETKPNSKWKYLTATAMVLCKLNAVILLLPLMLLYYFKARKKAVLMLTPALALVPYLVWTGVATGDMMYLVSHWQTMSVVGRGNIIYEFLPHMTDYVRGGGLLAYFVLTLPGFVVALRQREQLPFTLFYVITLVLGFGWGFIEYHVFAILLSGMFMTAISLEVLHKYLQRRSGTELLSRGRSV